MPNGAAGSRQAARPAESFTERARWLRRDRMDRLTSSCARPCVQAPVAAPRPWLQPQQGPERQQRSAADRLRLDAFEHKAKIGYSTRDALSPCIRGDVEREAVRIF